MSNVKLWHVYTRGVSIARLCGSGYSAASRSSVPWLWVTDHWPFVKLSFVKFDIVQHVFIQLTWILYHDSLPLPWSFSASAVPRNSSISVWWAIFVRKSKRDKNSTKLSHSWMQNDSFSKTADWLKNKWALLSLWDQGLRRPHVADLWTTVEYLIMFKQILSPEGSDKPLKCSKFCRSLQQ